MMKPGKAEYLQTCHQLGHICVVFGEVFENDIVSP